MATRSPGRSRDATIVAMNDPVVGTQLTTSEHLRAAREALGRHAWREAFELLSGADRDGGLSGQDLEALAEAGFFTAHADVADEARQRAFKAYLDEGNQVRAAAVALGLAREFAHKGKPSMASAWARRGERLLEGQEE